jgi:hypothetical protein
LWQKWYYRSLVAACGSANIVLLMIANLSILHGFEDTPAFLQRAFWREGVSGWTSLIGSLVILWIGVMLMLEKRAHERLASQEKKF